MVWKHRVGQPWYSEFPVRTNLNHYTFSGLRPNTSYEWRVQSVCANSTGSEYTGSTTFRTLPAPKPGETFVVENTGSMPLAAKVLPNPVEQQATLVLEGNFGSSDITIVTPEDKMLWKTTTSRNTLQLPVAHLPAGAYFIRIVNGKNSVTQSFIKQPRY